MDIPTILLQDAQKSLFSIGEAIGKSLLTTFSGSFNQVIKNFENKSGNREITQKVAPIIGIVSIGIAILAFCAYGQSLQERHE